MGKKDAQAKMFSVKVKTENEDGTVTTSDEEIQVCDQYFRDVTVSKVLGTSIGFIIIAVNLILKTSIIALITWIGEDTVSE